jgi:hypothetical protein
MPLRVSHVLSLTPTFSIKIERSTRGWNAHAMQIVKATSSCRWPECGLWRQSAVRRPGNGGNGKRAGEEALTREAGARVRFRFLSLFLSPQFVSSGLLARIRSVWRYSTQENVDKPGFPVLPNYEFYFTCAILTTCYYNSIFFIIF